MEKKQTEPESVRKYREALEKLEKTLDEMDRQHEKDMDRLDRIGLNYFGVFDF